MKLNTFDEFINKKETNMKNLKDMLNESRGDIDKDIKKKAKEIAEDNHISTGESCEEECYDCAILMAEWMKSYMIEKACKFMNQLCDGFSIKDNIMGMSYSKEELLKDFRKAMEK